MRLLLDSHAFLWWLSANPRLRPRAREAILAAASVVHVSAVSCWEIAIKAELGRIELRDVDLVAEIVANGFVELPVTAAHGLRAARLPRHHDDPFDRMLVAQALDEDLTLVTHDKRLGRYEVAILET